MSDQIISLPYLDINVLEHVHHKLKREHNSCGHHWFLTNRLSNKMDELIAQSNFIFINKAHAQIDAILTRVKELHTRIVSFSNGDFDYYIDEFNKWNTEGSQVFDPYNELVLRISTNHLDDLPVRISKFSELLGFCQTQLKREQVIEEGMKKLFGKLKKSYLVKDEDGNDILVPEDQMPKGAIEEIENKNSIQRDFKAISVEHVFDQYDDWLTIITEMVTERRPFFEMLPLFRKG